MGVGKITFDLIHRIRSQPLAGTKSGIEDLLTPICDTLRNIITPFLYCAQNNTLIIHEISDMCEKNVNYFRKVRNLK